MSAWPEKHIDVISAVRKNGLAVTKQTPGEKKSNKAQSIQTRLIQLGCLLVMLFLTLLGIPRTSAQRKGAGALPISYCQGGGFWDQYNNPATEPPVGIGSQQFEPAMATFDDQAAGDFVIGGGWGHRTSSECS